MLKRTPYNGPQEKLVLAFDVGTTYSGTSYCFLDPGEVPVIRAVTRYPAQEQSGGDAKIPTILYYDEAGIVQACGAEALGDNIELQAEENAWTKAEWFKLHLRPKTTSAAFVTEKIPSLPAGKTVVQVFADFLQYLYTHARKFIEETHAFGHIWEKFEERIDFVLTHPNGWEGGQQGLMREAAIMAGLISDTEAGHARLFFVTEGEASLHFCLQGGLALDSKQDGKGVVIVDAGGGTVDISAYRRSSQTSLSYEEIAPPQCAFKGSIFVTRNAREYFEHHLSGTKFEADVSQITEKFDKSTKLRFIGPDETQFIRFGRWSDNAPELNIRAGQLKLSGPDVANFFEPSISAIIDMINDQCNTATTKISSAFLVGGFAASNWLYYNLKEEFDPRGLDISRPDSHTNKAVADGAISYHIDHFVNSRVARHSYGIKANIPYKPSDPEHSSRSHLAFTNLKGERRISDHFTSILSKNTSVAETQEFRKSFWRESKDQFSPALNKISEPITAFRGPRKNPRWFDEDSEMYSRLCSVKADLSRVRKEAQYSNYRGSSAFYEVYFDIILSLGLTEFRACIAWKENGVEKRSPAQLVYDPEMVIDDSAPMI